MKKGDHIVDVVPRVLLSSQFNDAGQKIYYEECDCSCANYDFRLSTFPVAPDQPLRCAGLHSQQLPQSHTLMFNPLRDGGVAVLNSPARKLWEQFQYPHTLYSLGFAPGSDNLAVVEKMVEAGLLEGVVARTQTSIGAPRTLSVWLHITNACNLRCDYCYVSKANGRMSLETGRAAVDAVVRSATRASFRRVKLKFAGGEPTLNLELVFDLHTYAQERCALAGLELDAVILSNGVAISDRAISEFKSRGIRVMISLDGVGEVHDRQRKFSNGTGSFALVEDALDRLIAHGIKPFISITVSGRNADGLPNVIRYVLERDLSFNLNFFRDNDRARPFADLKLKQARVIGAIRRAFAVIEANLPEHSLLGSLLDRSQFSRPHDKTCGVGDSYLVVDIDGNVAKCHMKIEMPITNVYADDPLALVNEDRTGIQNVSVDDKEGCRECGWRYWCAGGCPVMAFRTAGRYDVKSPYCRVYKAVYPGLLRLEGLRLMKLARVATAA